MKLATTALVLCATFSVNAEATLAGLCTQQVDQFEAALRQSPMSPDAGATAPETIGAKLGHQPTPASVEAAETRAGLQVASVLAKARALDAQGKPAACMRALADAKLMYAPQ
jgi:hypothetical protein